MGTGMAPAWQAREMTRDRLLNRLMDDVLDKDERMGEERRFLWRIGITLARYLLRLESQGPPYAEKEGFSFTGGEEQAVIFFFVADCIIRPVKEFARVPAEAALHYHQLLLKILETAGAPFERVFSEHEGLIPQLIYGVPSAMDKVPLPEED